MDDRRRVAVVGAGSFGTALANHIANNGHQVSLWGRDAATVQQIAANHENQRYLPGIKLSPSISCSSVLEESVAQASDVLLAVPSKHFKSFLDQIVACTPDSCSVIWACKGLESGTGRFLSDVANDTVSNQRKFAVISGPTFARELASGLPTAVVASANQSDYAQTVAHLLRNDRFRTYISDDIRGVQLGGALKNIYAIAAGISDGLNFGANARVAVISRGLAELMRLGEKLGVRSETLMGLSGTGDLILTCTDDQSRNRRFGLALGNGMSSTEAVESIGQSVEGVVASGIAWKLAQQYDVSMPIVEQVEKVIAGKVRPTEAVVALLGRETKAEVH